MNKISNLHSTLFILDKCVQKIERLYLEFHGRTDLNPEYYRDKFAVDIGNYIILESVSFIAEYQEHFNPKNVEIGYEQRIQNVRSATKPIMMMIRRWKDLEKYRHLYIAHPNRDQKNGYKLIISGQEPYDAPRRTFEFKLLHDLIIYCFSIISQEFAKELNEAIFFGNTLKPVTNPLKDNSKIRMELKDMVDKFKDVCASAGEIDHPAPV
jgi:hypothetical protein